jgi:hypothetical protein
MSFYEELKTHYQETTGVVVFVNECRTDGCLELCLRFYDFEPLFSYVSSGSAVHVLDGDEY